MHLTELSFRRQAFVYFLLVCMIAGGILAYRSISKLEDPELVVMQSQIVTIWPGATAHEVEWQVTQVIEDALNTLANVESVRSRSMAGLSVVAVTLELTVPQDEIEQYWDYLRRRIGEAEAKLPAGAMAPVIYDDFGDVYGMFYGMTAEGYNYREMSKMARYVQRELLAVEGIARVELFGEQDPVTSIIFTPSKMGELDVFPLQVISAINGQNSMVYPGMLNTGNQQLAMVVDGMVHSAEDLGEVMVKNMSGRTFKLGDIADIREEYGDPPRRTFQVNNQSAIGISLSMESGENIIRVGNRVEKRLAELQAYMPLGYQFEKVFFQPDLVSQSIDGFMFNLIASVLIVILVLMIFMGLRSGLIIGSGLVLTIMATFPILLAAGGTLQRISLGAFIVAMGMLVDNAIVVIDGILVDIKKGINRKQALVDPARRTAWPLLGATFIAVAAFLPVYLSQDAAGTYARDLFIVLCISLLISWVLAMTQVPLFAASLLKNRHMQQSSEQFTGWGYRKLRQWLNLLLHYKTATLVTGGIMLMLAALNFGNIKKTFFPDFNYNQVYVEYRLPAGTGPQRVNDDLRQITAYLQSLKEVGLVVSSHGQTPSRYCLVRPMGEAADHYGELIINFSDYKTMRRMKPLISAYLHEYYPDARIRIRKYNLSIKASHTIEAEFSGPDPAVLNQLSQQAIAVFRSNPYADPYTIEDDWEPMGKMLRAQYTRQAAARAGISRQDVSNALLTATDGLPIGFYYDGQTRVGLQLKLRDSDGSRIGDPREIPVWPMLPDLSGLDEGKLRGLLMGIGSLDDLIHEVVSPVPLSAVTHGLTLDWEEQVVRRTNGRRAIQVQCEPLDGYSPALVRNTSKAAIEGIPLPPGYELKWVGEYELQGEALRNIFRYLPISIMLIILTLILLFNDIRKPLIVLICIPMAFIGIVPGMIITGQPFTFMAIIGSFGLMGMIVKNAIVLLDEAERLISSGAEKHLALIQATISRARPVLLASFTTILGMLPLVTDPMYGSMATAIISGLLIGTLITLLFVPILYAAFFRVKPQSVIANML